MGRPLFELANQDKEGTSATKYMDVSKNSGTPKSSILIEFSIINHPFWGTPILGNTHIQYAIDGGCKPS